jgi:hypothetical protein
MHTLLLNEKVQINADGFAALPEPAAWESLLTSAGTA